MNKPKAFGPLVYQVLWSKDGWDITSVSPGGNKYTNKMLLGVDVVSAFDGKKMLTLFIGWLCITLGWTKEFAHIKGRQ